MCLIGASGSGKSTLLRCIDLLEPVDAGRIWVEGIEITAPGVDENAVRRRIGIVFQAFNLFPHMTCCATSPSRPARRFGCETVESEERRSSPPRAVRAGRQA